MYDVATLVSPYRREMNHITNHKNQVIDGKFNKIKKSNRWETIKHHLHGKLGL